MESGGKGQGGAVEGGGWDLLPAEGTAGREGRGGGQCILLGFQSSDRESA